MADTTEELNERFGTSLEPDVLAELESIMRLHSLDVEELWYKWESYSMKMDSNKLDIETARALKKDVQDGLEREARGRQQHVLQGSRKKGAGTPRSGVGMGGGNGDVFGMLESMGTPSAAGKRGTGSGSGSARRKFETSTPSVNRVKVEMASSPPEFKTPYKPGEYTGAVTSFHDRPNAGQMVEVLNEHLPTSEPPMAPFSEPRIKLTANSDMKKLSYKPMAMKSSEASEILDDRIDEYMAIIQAHHKLEDSAFGSAASQSTNEIVAVGRIASDSLTGKLNQASLVLETSRRMGAGIRIPLKVDALPGFQFFPGQLVAMRGINASGEHFTVSEILEAPLLSSAASPPSAIEAHIQRLRGGPDAMDSDSPATPLSILLASGPYTSDSNLNFEPLHALCSQASDTYADALILTGPFLDIDHPLIASGDFDLPAEAMNEPDTATMTTVFKYLISPAFHQLVAANPNITILLIPSVKDVISKHVSWPQEPFPKKELGLPKSVRILGNPMTISLNEIAFGISSQDILTELQRSEIVGGKMKDSNLLARLPKYMIEQRNFFPLFPAAERDALPKTGTGDGRPTGSVLDVGYGKLGEMINVRPDVLVVPSSLPAFAKVVESVIVINPGYLSKRKAAGTYTKITIYPYPTEELEGGNGMVAHKVFERARVDILRI